MIEQELRLIAGDYVNSYNANPIGYRINSSNSPSGEQVHALIELLVDLSFPGFFSANDIIQPELELRTLASLKSLSVCLTELILSSNEDHSVYIDKLSVFLRKLPYIRNQLLVDLQSAIDGDPAAVSFDEVILVYPGLLAVSVYRYAHQLYLLGIPLVPRMMAGWAHKQTGIDIHPAAKIGPGLFIDHGTGVVIGETAVIGKNVKLYQGVTLGALSFPKDETGAFNRHMQRHPTIEDNVTIYANATVLGGKTIVSAGSVIGASVFLSESVAPDTVVKKKKPSLEFVSQRYG